MMHQRPVILQALGIKPITAELFSGVYFSLYNKFQFLMIYFFDNLIIIKQVVNTSMSYFFLLRTISE